jgi:glycosyltransferase involved in cell wall biosynthesis
MDLHKEHKIRLHLLAVPHTITRDEFSHCAFTGKVQRFSPMMRSRGYEVFHYGVETSQSGADKDINLLSVQEWQELRLASFLKLFPDKSLDEAKKKLSDPTAFVGDLGNWSTPLYKEFNRRARAELQKNYRSTRTDIVCLPFGPAHEDAMIDLNVIKVETGIGYNNAKHDFRIYESYAILHTDIEKSKSGLRNYWFVAPNYYNIAEWSPVETDELVASRKNRVGFLGRIGNLKGCHIISEIARRMPHVQFVLCGQGDASTYVNECPNIEYKAPIHGADRQYYLASLSALLTPSNFMEPFCGVNVEAQLCGTPVISHDYGVFNETVEQFKTGLRCHTLEDFCVGINMALKGEFDRSYIRKRALEKWDMFVVARQYDYIFRCINDVSNGKNGWYSDVSHISLQEK